MGLLREMGIEWKWAKSTIETSFWLQVWRKYLVYVMQFLLFQDFWAFLVFHSQFLEECQKLIN